MLNNKRKCVIHEISGIFPQTDVACFFVCNFVKICQNLLNEVPVERSILAAFAVYHLNRWFSRYVIATMMVDGKQKVAH